MNTEQPILPQHFIDDRRIDTLLRGKSVYVVDWDMRVNQDGKCFLDRKAFFKESYGGTFNLRITHTGRGFVVHVGEDVETAFGDKAVRYKNWKTEQIDENDPETDKKYIRVIGFGNLPKSITGHSKEKLTVKERIKKFFK